METVVTHAPCLPNALRVTTTTTKEKTKKKRRQSNSKHNDPTNPPETFITMPKRML